MYVDRAAWVAIGKDKPIPDKPEPEFDLMTELFCNERLFKLESKP